MCQLRHRSRSRGCALPALAVLLLAASPGGAVHDAHVLDRLAEKKGTPQTQMLPLNCRSAYAGERPGREELERMLDAHAAWLARGRGEAGEQADLCRAQLHWRDFTGRDLGHALLAGAVLHGAHLQGAILKGADLGGAILDGADLTDADLSGAKLDGASFYDPHPGETRFAGSVLRGAGLRWVNLSRFDLSGLDLREASLHDAVLIQSDLRGSDLSGANLHRAILYGARLDGANLASARLEGVDLRGATLVDADLRGAFFAPAAVEPRSLFGVRGLSEIEFEDPGALVKLREELKQAGLRAEHRAVVSAQRKNRLRWATTRERIFETYLLGGALSDFGAEPWRPVGLLGVGVLLFTVVYVVPLRFPREEAGIWRVWPGDRLAGVGSDTPELVRCRNLFAAIGIGFFFSLISAFRVGWRELNAGQWIARLQPSEYSLRASGWVRSVAGVQSLLSVYLLALWALCYFGTPFE